MSKGKTDCRTIRDRLGLSQSEFAAALDISIRAIQDWEQGARTPRGPARTLLRVVDQYPEIFVTDKPS